MPRCSSKLLLVATCASLCGATPALLASPKDWIRQLDALNAMPVAGNAVDTKAAYLNFLSSVLTSSSLECNSASDDDAFLECAYPMRMGRAWPKLGVTMAGHKRLQNIMDLLLRVHEAGVGGSYLEAGVWRGGMSIFATAVVEVYGLDRKVYLCDSFEGLPPPREGSLRADETAYVEEGFKQSLSMGEAHVADNFRMYGVPMERVQLVKGFFVNSLPILREQLIARNERLSVLRMDGDMYDSTIDILYSLYDRVAVGGYVVIDDFGWFDGTQPGSRAVWGAKDAVLDFRRVHGIEDAAHTMHDIDGWAAYFQKRREVTLQRDLYLRCVQTKDYTPLQPTPKLTPADYNHLLNVYTRYANHSHRRQRNSQDFHHGMRAFGPWRPG